MRSSPARLFWKLVALLASVAIGSSSHARYIRNMTSSPTVSAPARTCRPPYQRRIADAVGMRTAHAMSTVRDSHHAMTSCRIWRWLLRANRAVSLRCRPKLRTTRMPPNASVE